MGKISFILHGKTRGKAKLISEITQVLGAIHTLEYFLTEEANQAEKLALDALNDGCDYLIAVGGDGTLNEVVNAYLKSGGRDKFKTVIGVLPWGTGNDFVKTTGNQKSVEQLGQLINKGSVRIIDAGEIIYRDKTSKGGIRFFDNIADIGIGAEIVSKVNAVHIRKVILGGTLLFFFTALRILLMYRHKAVKVYIDDFVWEGKLLSLVVANGRFFGSGLGVAPDAQLNDGLFQVVIFGNLSVFDYLRHYSTIRKSQKLDLPEVFYFQARQVKVESIGCKAVVEADGEVGQEAPVTFTCLPGVIPFLAPLND
jgi:diacylglycerol kinase (ATP)